MLTSYVKLDHLIKHGNYQQGCVKGQILQACRSHSVAESG